jgi:hypothetical protein
MDRRPTGNISAHQMIRIGSTNMVEGHMPRGRLAVCHDFATAVVPIAAQPWFMVLVFGVRNKERTGHASLDGASGEQSHQGEKVAGGGW